MAGAVGIVFGLCVLSFTLGAALMYVLVRRREDAGTPSASPADEPVERTWVERPAAIEPVDDDYDSRPIHRNPVVGLPQLEPALASFAEPIVVASIDTPEVVEEAEESEAEPAEDAAVKPESESEPAEDAAVEPEPESVAVVEPEAAEEAVVEPEPEPVAVVEPEVVVETALPPPATPQPVEHTTWVEREDFRQRYLRTFEEVRRKAGSN